MATDQSRIEAIAHGILRGAIRGIRLGPGVLGTVAPVGIAGFIAIAAMVWALRENVSIAVGSAFLGFIFLGYFVERAFRYAEKNPIPALLGGSDLSQLIRDQMGAKDKSIITDAAPIAGSATKMIESIGATHE